MIIYSAALLLLIYILFKIFTTFSERIACAFSGINSSETQRHDIQELFFRTVFTLLGYVAKRDGAINYLEVRYTESYMEKMNLDSAHKREAIRLFKLGAEPKFRADKTIKQFQWLAQKSPNLAQILLSYLINIARADGFLVNKEIEAVEKVALGLGYSTITFRHLLRMLSVKNQPCDPIIKILVAPPKKILCRYSQLEAAYSVFNASPCDSDAAIKKSYRTLANQYHPDKLSGLGFTPIKIKHATESFQKIQASYTYIKDSRK